MERKIGEIFEYNGEWYQCVVALQGCRECSFRTQDYCTRHSECLSIERSDKKSVAFKKLEKVGEPFTSVGKLYQHYKVFDIDNVYGDVFWCVHNYKAKTLTIEIKQNKEDMEDLDKIKVRDYTKVEELNVMEEKKLNLKPFDIQKAREGKPVCTRDGRKARIICFDRVGDFPIVALTDDRDYKEEGVNLYDINGKGSNECFDLMMLPEKKVGWINVYKGGKLDADYIYTTKADAVENIFQTMSDNYIDTIKVEWEE